MWSLIGVFLLGIFCGITIVNFLSTSEYFDKLLDFHNDEDEDEDEDMSSDSEDEDEDIYWR